jgi:hypothetical protein
MRNPERRIRFLVPALALIALLAPSVVRAQAPEPQTIHCGPSSVGTGDLVAVNVGYPGLNVGSADVLVRLLNSEGALLLERRLALAPGQSRSVRYTVPAATARRLVVGRGEIALERGPVEPVLLGTFQLFGLGLTYGPKVLCSGDTGSRGPV